MPESFTLDTSCSPRSIIVTGSGRVIEAPLPAPRPAAPAPVVEDDLEDGDPEPAAPAPVVEDDLEDGDPEPAAPAPVVEDDLEDGDPEPAAPATGGRRARAKVLTPPVPRPPATGAKPTAK